MSKNVFISGSINISKLPRSAIAKLDSIIEKGFSVLVGDAKGVDLQVQKYLLKKKYNKVKLMLPAIINRICTPSM